MRRERGSPRAAAFWPARPAAALALCLAACGGRGGAAPERVVLDAPGAELRTPVDPDFVPAFDALHAAVEAGDDALARSILAGILARRPPEHLEDFARGYERILDGRLALAGVELALASEDVVGSEVDHRLVLRARNALAEEVLLRLPPAALKRTLTSVGPNGDQSRSTTTEAIDALALLRVGPGATVVVPLCAYELDARGALAVRERWTLETRSGSIQVGARELPAREPAVAAAERTRVAAFLPDAPVEPEELVRYLESESPFVPALMERAVRIAPERREEALDALVPCIARLAASDPERLRVAAPALRWLARDGRPGNDPSAWTAWFAGRERAARAQERGGLVLPEGDGR